MTATAKATNMKQAPTIKLPAFDLLVDSAFSPSVTIKSQVTCIIFQLKFFITWLLKLVHDIQFVEKRILPSCNASFFRHKLRYLWKKRSYSESWQNKFLKAIVIFTLETPRVEVPEIISTEQLCCTDLKFFSADSENMKYISAVSELISSDSFLIKAVRNWKIQHRWPLNSADLGRISSGTALFSVDFSSSETLDTQRLAALIQHWFPLNQL